MGRRFVVAVLTFCLLLTIAGTLSAAVFYVDRAAAGLRNGTSWANAFNTIQEGIDAASVSGGGEVWVKAGTYTGCNTSPVCDSFELKNPNAVDIIAEELAFKYVENGKPLQVHVNVLYLTGDTTVSPTPASFGPTKDYDSFITRLTALKESRSDTMIFINHPSSAWGTVRPVSYQNMAAAVNAGLTSVMEIKQPEDIALWDNTLAHLDDQAGACSKIIWGITCEDQHYTADIGSAGFSVNVGIMPKVEQDPAYANRRVAFRDMVRRGSFMILPPRQKCGLPTYTMESEDGTVSRFALNVSGVDWPEDGSAEVRFYGCDWATGNTPGTLLCSAPVTQYSTNTISYYFTTTGASSGAPLTAVQKANVKYIRPELVWNNSGAVRRAHFNPVRIRSNGDWWNGPAYTPAGAGFAMGPSPYPAGGADSGETVYFDPHSHSLMSDGDATPQTVRTVFWERYGELYDATKPRFVILADHDRCTPFSAPVRSVISLDEGVKVYGGFSGTETRRDQRDWAGRQTTIDAQQAGRCVYAYGQQWENKTNCVLDGFTIANGQASSNGVGGGLYIRECSPWISNCTITLCQATYGGGVWDSSASPTFQNCVFRNNTVGSSPPWRPGGGMLNEFGSAPNISNCTFDGNTARRGGAMANCVANPKITDTLFNANRSDGFQDSWGGALFNWRSSPYIWNCRFTGNSCNAFYGYGGALYNDQGQPTICQCTFADNQANGGYGAGGAMYNRSASPQIASCVFVGNSATGAEGTGGAIYCGGNGPVVITNNTIYGNSAYRCGGIRSNNCEVIATNNIIAGNTLFGVSASGNLLSLSYNDIFGNTINYDGTSPGTGNISVDPLFVNPIQRDFHLAQVSPCVNVGSNAAPEIPVYDMEGEARVSSRTVDIGADEFTQVSTGPGLKTVPNGQAVSINSAVITATFSDCFYVTIKGRPWGIQVRLPSYSLTVGTAVNITGTIKTGLDGERYIEATSVVPCGTATVRPLRIVNRSLGGGSWYYSVVAGTGQKGVVGGQGLNNLGMLISTTGRVTHSDESAFYIDDGSSTQDSYGMIEGHTGVRVVGSVPVPPGTSPVGKYVQVIGISTCYQDVTNLYRQIRARSVTILQ